MTNIHQFEPLWGVWKIEEELGEGSYGKVYKAVRNEFGATYYAAIKHISIPINQTEIRNLYEEGLAADEGSARRYYERMLANLLQEIRLMSALKGHTNIVAYEDHMTIEKRDMPGYDVFIRMELLKGLYEHARSTKFTVLDVCNLGIDICTALEILQKKNIVHRDIKPANILYSDDGNYKLSDFGVARTLEHNATVMSKKGTYAYMAPEVYGGQPASFNSDVYSLGLVMHRLLNNNRAPFLPADGSTVTYGQCNVNGWNNIAEIATGAHHTVGLKKDGTVVATGSNNEYGQCNISEWKLNVDTKLPTALLSTTKQPSSSSIAATPEPTLTPKPSATPKPTKEQSDTESASGGNELRIEQSRDLMKHVNKYRSDAGVSALS